MLHILLQLVITILAWAAVPVAAFYPDAIFLLSYAVATGVTTKTLWLLLPGPVKNIFPSQRKFYIGTALCMFSFPIAVSAVIYFGLPKFYDKRSIAVIAYCFLLTGVLWWRFVIVRWSRRVVLLAALTALLILLSSYFIATRADTTIVRKADLMQGLAYAPWVVDESNIDKTAVQNYIPEKSSAGYNLFTCVTSLDALLTDMKGKIIRKWSIDKRGWHYVTLGPDGNLYGIILDKEIVCMSWGGKLIYRKQARVHHDLAVADDGTVYALTRDYRFNFKNGLPIPLLDNFISTFPPGEDKETRLSIWDLVSGLVPSERLGIAGTWGGLREFLKAAGPKEFMEKLLLKNLHGGYEVLHTNTLQILDRRIEGFCEKGDILICVRNLDLIAVVDVVQKRLRWSWGTGQLDRPHHPTLLPNNHLLIFDNGMHRDHSRVIEIDPLTGKTVWEYKAVPPQMFRSFSRGSNQRLPNGNTLIAESNKGYVFEVTPDKEIVWDYYSPETIPIVNARKAIYRMMRISPKTFEELENK